MLRNKLPRTLKERRSSMNLKNSGAEEVSKKKKEKRFIYVSVFHF
ncbi:unnamed protein product [Linum tenue]|uniref:Uncharacterized protein n=1 Tax=Linum tenue TaxID=586396 RepID=A0AAV0NN60_9ROSI|nr:unnamed protein product [Linum tenue]